MSSATTSQRPATGAVYPARPRLAVDGRDEPAIAAGLLAMVVEEDLAGMRRAEVTLGNWGTTRGSTGYLYFGRDTLDFGAGLVISAGDADAAGPIFDGRISAIEAAYPRERPPEITLLAEDRLRDLRTARRTRVFEDASDADIISRIASDHGLTPDVSIDGPRHRAVAQVNTTDLAFARERAAAADGVVWVDGRTLHAAPRSRARGDEVRLSLGRTLRELAARADLAHQCTTLAVTGWDPEAGEAVAHRADDACVSAEAGGGQTGAAILASAFGERDEHVAHRLPITSDAARMLAEAGFRARARRFVTCRAVAEPDARLRPGSPVILDGLGPMFDGRYLLTAVRHEFRAVDGLSTRFEAERAAIDTPA